MAVYAIGDPQGCLAPLRRLLARLDFDPGQDRLWIVGDLVNRGPDSLATLRFVRDLGESAITVLGNHDLTLLAAAHGVTAPKKKDTYQEILDAPDRDELLDWLRRQPLLHHDPALGYTMIHAGLPPQWDLATAMGCARELEAVLQGPDHGEFFHAMFGAEPRRWDPALAGMARLRFITNCFTRMRFLYPDGSLDFEQKGPPGSQPPPLLPWFEVPGRRSADLILVFGHWAAMGYRERPGIYGLESGCVWGNCMTALRLDGPPFTVTEDCGDIR